MKLTPDILSREKYDRLIAIKRRFDPGYVFTANGLGVDATSAPYKQCVKIVECDVSLWWAEGDARIVGSPLKQCTRVGNCFHTSYSAAILAVSAIDSVTAVTVQLKLKHVYSLLCVGKKVPE